MAHIILTDDVMKKLNCSRSTLYRRWFKHPDFPKAIGGGYRKWRESDIDEFIEKLQ